MRLVVARCEVLYTGRLTAFLPESTRLLMLKSDGSVLRPRGRRRSDKPLNWMSSPTTIEEEGDPLELIVVRKRAGKSEDRLEIRIHELLSDVAHEMGEAAALEKDGVERQLQAELAAARLQPSEKGSGSSRREWPTDIGPVDLMCRDEGRRVGGGRGQAGGPRSTRSSSSPATSSASGSTRRWSACAGVLAAQQFKPQAVTLAEAREIRCVEVDLDELRGEREPELTLFAPL